jgi:hypothetical protein
MQVVEQREVVVDRLREADPGVDLDALDRSWRKTFTSSTTSSYTASACIVRGVPRMCIRQTSAPRSATRAAMSGSPRSAVTSLT